MPTRRKTRLASRTKPVLPPDTEEINLDDEARKAKLEAYLKDFDIEVKNRVAEMQRMCDKMCSQIGSATTLYIMRLPREIKKMKQSDYFAQNAVQTGEKVIEEFSKTVDEMVSKTLPHMSQIVSASSSSEADEDTASSAATDTDGNETSSGRPSRTKRKKATASRKKGASTAKRATARKRTRAALQETPASQDNTKNTAFQTPANTMSISSMSTPFITPKFDPSSKITPASMRRAKKGELLVSLSGSPVEARNSPKDIDSVDKLKENMEHFFEQDKALNAVDRRNILMLQETLTRMLKQKTKMEPDDS